MLLATLSSEDRALIAPRLETIELRGGAGIASSTSPVDRVCFPLTMVASFGEEDSHSRRFDVGVIGREGMIGWPVLLGASHSVHSGRVVLGGTALVIPSVVLMAACDQSRSLHTSLLRFIQTFTVQLGQTVVTNLRDPVNVRLARWLLMLHDRIDGDEIAVTHNALSDALNVRRSSVTDGLHEIEGERMLRCDRGRILVRDRAALMYLAGVSYGTPETCYRSLIAPFGKRAATG